MPIARPNHTANWFAKPKELSPPVCARYGWSNTDLDELQCEICNVRIQCPPFSKIHNLEESRQKASDFLEQVKSSHSSTCPFSASASGLVSDTPYRFPVLSTSTFVRCAQKRVQRILRTTQPDCVLSLLPIPNLIDDPAAGALEGSAGPRNPQITVDEAREVLIRQNPFLEPLPDAESLLGSKLAQENVAVILALCGWEPMDSEMEGHYPHFQTSLGGCLICRLCLRTIPTRLFESMPSTASYGGSDLTDEARKRVRVDESRSDKATGRRFNPTKEHRWYCPWVSPQAGGAHEGQSGCQITVKAVSKMFGKNASNGHTGSGARKLNVLDARSRFRQFLIGKLSQMDAPMPLPDPSVVVSANVQDVNLADALLFDPDQYDAQEKYPHGTIDRGAPPLPFKYFAKEAAAISKMKEFLDIGKRLIARLYTYRSLGRSLPQVMPSHDDCTRSEIYQETHALLQPAVEKMKDLMAFRDAAVQIVVDVVSAVVQDASHGVGGKEKERDLFASTGFLSALAGMLSMFVVLDTMKNLKGSMNNDFSLFKRTIANLQQPGGDSVPAQNGEDSALHHRLYLFLAQQDQFGLELKRTLRERVPRFEDILIDVAHFCADSVESQLYLLQDTKHSYLKAAAFALFLMDDVGDERDLTKRKRFKLAPFFKLFKAYPIVPLYGDIPLALSSIYYKAPHLKHEEAFLNSLNANGINSLKERQMDQYNLLSKVSGMKKGLKEILARISKCVIEAEVEHKAKRVLSHAQNASIYRVAFDAVRFLAALTGALIEQNAWKLSNPSQPGPECDSASAYELAVQHNYSNQERGGLLEYVVAIRSLRAVLLQGERVFQPAITQYIYAETQSFIDLKMEEFALQGIKKKRAIGWILKLARLIGLNQTGGEHPSVSAVVVNDSFEEIPLSSTQLHFVRTFLDFASNAKSKGMKGSLLREKDFKDAQVVQIENFLNESFFYSHMQEWIDTIQKCSDLSDLWLKEFYLELSKRVQFPISASLPWILLECIIESQEPSVIELAFYPLEIYNDAAARSLYSLKNQCIYDEVLAELNLCFDQLVFRIAEHIFVHYKKAASRALLASTSRSDLYSKSHHKDLPTSLYDPILKQKVIKLVGRSIDLSRLLANLINEHIRRSLDIAISRYEASDLTFVVEFESLVNSAKKTHELLSQWLDLQDFGQILLSANRENELSGMGRIFSHTCRELVNDFIPNFCFQSATSTFIRAAISFIEPPQRPSFGKVPAQYLHGNKALSIEFALHHSDMRNFLSDEHFECIACIHSREEILMIVDTIAEHVDNLSKNALTDYVDTAIQGMPASLKLPLFDYGSEGAYDFFTAHLKPLLNYKYLHSEIFQGFREVGNSILAAKMLSDALDCGNKEICHIRKSFTSEPGEVQKNFERIADLDDKIDSESYPLSMEKWIEFVTAEELGRETGGALMARFMSQFSATILDVSTAWASKSNEDSSIFSSVAFFRFWCALQFVYCLSPSVIGSSEGFHGDKAMRELFGDGVPWAGLTILHSLGENGMFKAMDFNNHILSILRAEANKQASTAEIKGVFPGVPSPGSQSATQRPDFLFFVDAATFTEALSNDISRYFFFHFCVGSGY